MSLGYYILDEKHVPQHCGGPFAAQAYEEWRHSEAGERLTIVGQDILPGAGEDERYAVSTLFLGLDHSFPGFLQDAVRPGHGPALRAQIRARERLVGYSGTPVLWESIVFRCSAESREMVEQVRYTSHAEAVRGHTELVARFGGPVT